MDYKYFTGYTCKEEITIYKFSKFAGLPAYRKKNARILAIQTHGKC